MCGRMCNSCYSSVQISVSATKKFNLIEVHEGLHNPATLVALVSASHALLSPFRKKDKKTVESITGVCLLPSI